MIRADLAAKIREKRAETGLTLEQLAQKVSKTSRGNLSRIERGEINITVDRWLQICKALDIKITLD